MPAPVTIKGWLYKRGNDGLKLWKKRYFVLSEYCLSYYKGAHDEKASGTILLPSYRYVIKMTQINFVSYKESTSQYCK